MAERVKRALELRGMTPSDLIAKKVLSKAGVYFILDGTTKADKIRATTVDKLSRALRVNGEWIQYGKGQMEARAAHAVSDDDSADLISSTPVSPPATPEGYVRFNLFEGGAGLGLGVANADYPEVIRTVDIAEWQIRKKLGFLPAPGRMQLITGRGPSMRPKIEDGDVVMIDTTCNYFDGDDYYLISVDGEAQIKMLQKRVDGIYVVSSNSEFREWRIDPADLVVCGKALIGLGLRRL